MKTLRLFGSCAVVLASALHGEADTTFPEAWIESARDSHTLSLPNWGPYTKRYVGISHTPPANPGMRFDLSVFPGLYNRKANVPNVLFESDYHPWEASSDLRYFSFRHEVEWKDQVYADISYSWIDDHSRLVRADLVNSTDLPQSLELHLMASVAYPSVQPASVSLPAGACCVRAIDYDTLRFGRARPTDSLVYDGKRRGEVRGDGFCGGSGLGDGFGADAGDLASYSVALPDTISDAQMLLRYKLPKGASSVLSIEGITTAEVRLEGNGEFEFARISLGVQSPGTKHFTVGAKAPVPLELDSFVIAPEGSADLVTYSVAHRQFKPEIIPGPKAQSLVLKYKDMGDAYGLSWGFEGSQVREFLCQDLDLIVPIMAQNHVKTVFQGEGEGHFTDIYLRPIPVPPHSHRVLYARVYNGTAEHVSRQIAADAAATPSANEALWNAARGHRPDLAPSPSGAGFQFSEERMAATLLCNVVYPVYTQGSYIKHNTPGRWWDSLYTWDSGFIGLGLDELDLRRSFECLNAYLTPPGAQSAFIHHGSMVPVQHYLFLDLWNRTQSRPLLEYCYPRLRQYYLFYVGRLGSSTMGKFSSGLLSSFDYFYNSGGWDDYPPQKATHEQGLSSRMAPVVNSAQAIRIAKIMIMAASELGLPEDVAMYRADVARLSGALQQYAWDEQSGYFGYVRHDAAGAASGIFRTPAGVNYNRGLDGVYPLVAGVGTASQTATMLRALKSPSELWSQAGLSAVDQSAPYYRKDGYWNGTVWMPHQWFFWKSMLDLGEADFAWQIARTGLEVWKTETDASYYCMENFVIETKRGAGWHEFGGLSSPVIKWYSSYFRPGTLTVGFNTWITRRHSLPQDAGMTVDLRVFQDPGRESQSTVIACLNPGRSYHATWKGQEVRSTSRAPGLLEITLPAGSDTGTLVISPAP